MLETVNKKLKLTLKNENLSLTRKRLRNRQIDKQKRK